MNTRRMLEDLPDMYTDLEDALHGTRNGGESERVTGGGGDERPAPLQMQVAEHRHQVLHDLRWWVSHYAHPTQPVGSSVPAMSALLLDALDELGEDDEQALHDTLRDLYRRAYALTDLPQLRGTLPLGDCLNADGELWQCEGALFAMLPADPSRPIWLQCMRGCGARWDVTELPEARNVLLPQAAAAELLGVSPSTIWRRVGKRAGMVRLADVLTA